MSDSPEPRNTRWSRALNHWLNTARAVTPADERRRTAREARDYDRALYEIAQLYRRTAFQMAGQHLPEGDVEQAILLAANDALGCWDEAIAGFSTLFRWKLKGRLTQLRRDEHGKVSEALTYGCSLATLGAAADGDEESDFDLPDKDAEREVEQAVERILLARHLPGLLNLFELRVDQLAKRDPQTFGGAEDFAPLVRSCVEAIGLDRHSEQSLRVIGRDEHPGRIARAIEAELGSIARMSRGGLPTGVVNRGSPDLRAIMRYVAQAAPALAAGSGQRVTRAAPPRRSAHR